MSILSDNIQKRRWELNMSLEKLAQKTGYKGRTSIHKIENGECDIPYSKIERFAEALDTTIIALMGLDGEENRFKNTTKPKLIILAGLSGSGKSYIISKMIKMHDNIEMVKRYSVRDEWVGQDESQDTVDKAKEEIRKCDIREFGYRVEFGCKTADIDAVLARNKSPIITAGIALGTPLKKIYPDALSIFLTADPTLQETMMIRTGNNPEAVFEKMEFQKKAMFSAFDDSIYDYIVPNRYDEVVVDVVSEIIRISNPKIDVKGAINLKYLSR